MAWAGVETEVAAATLVAGYLIGSIPFGLLLTKAAGLGDIRAIGSGNIGATNVLRTGHKGLALATLLLDGGKGAAAVLAVTLLVSPAAGMVAGLGAVIGHNFPVWLKFKGGKGVATTLGVMLAAAPIVGVLACATWAAVALIFRFSSLAALVALAMSPFYALILGDYAAAAVFAALAVLGWARHHANIARLLKGEEPKIGANGEVTGGFGNGTNAAKYFEIGGTFALIAAPITFIGAYIYCIASYGFLLGLGLGWLPSGILAIIVGIAIRLLWGPILFVIGLGLLALLVQR